MWIERDISQVLTTAFQKRPCLLLTGPRQTGKTSLVKKLFPALSCVCLDDLAEAEKAETTPRAFLADHEAPLIIDEVQYAPQIFRQLKIAIDAARTAMGQYILTGSQKFSLMEKAAESLAGRVEPLELHPLSLAEIERTVGSVIDADTVGDYIVRGGYPEMYAMDLDPQQYYASYVATYLERDVRQIINVKNLRAFDRFVRLAAVRTGQLLSISGFAGDLGISQNTVHAWLSVLEASGIVHIVEPWFQNLGKRIIKTPKVYFLDTGLACFCAGIRSRRDLQHSPLRGQLFETHVLNQIVRYHANHGIREPIYFFRDSNGLEVDFVMNRGGRMRLIEVKSAEAPDEKKLPFRAILKAAGEDAVYDRTVVVPRRGYRRLASGTAVSDSIDLDWLAT